MSANPPKIVIFGDSHYACIRMAQTGGLFDPSGLDLEYWGHVGRRFNFLEYRDGAIVPKDEFTADRFAKFNERNRRFLPAADFDMVVFMGARIDVTLLMAQLLMAGHHLPSVSRGLRHRMARDRLHALPAYGFARGLAATKTARIVVAPVSFPTEGLGRPYATPSVQASSGDDRAVAWEFLAARRGRRGHVHSAGRRHRDRRAFHRGALCGGPAPRDQRLLPQECGLWCGRDAAGSQAGARVRSLAVGRARLQDDRRKEDVMLHLTQSLPPQILLGSDAVALAAARG
ncbi:MAG: hypothetical protein HC844_15285 [Tabrizicola sp.]|nr:hypothetical protein [Tabrizicola sp.]